MHINDLPRHFGTNAANFAEGILLSYVVLWVNMYVCVYNDIYIFFNISDVA